MRRPKRRSRAIRRTSTTPKSISAGTRPFGSRNSIAQQEAADQAAKVSQLKASIALNKAAVFNAKTQLGYTTITSPIDGVTGFRQVDVGQYPPAHRHHPNIASQTLGMVPLSELVTLRSTTAPLAVNHQGQFPSVTISLNVKRNAPLGPAEAAVNETIAALHLPSTIQTGFQGNAQAFQASLSSEPMLILGALIAVYIILGMLYENLVHPLTIISTLPAAGLGALLTLYAFGFGLDVIGMVGIILLIGIVKKNGIMLVDFALDAERNSRPDPRGVHS